MNHATGTAPNMLQAALWYAARGWHVFPLHAPLFGPDGVCVGCSCETWKRTHYNKPDYKCPQPGKCPAVRWADKSTTEPEQLRKWFDHQWKAAHPETGEIIHFTPNLGIDCGKSGLLAFDVDTYKENYGGADLLSQADKQTVTSLTGGGGEHLLYDAQGKTYGNAKGTLPAGIDIRGTGGYIVGAPSLHKSGRRYQFEDGYNPTEIDLLPIPHALAAILEDAQATRRTAQAVTFTTPTTEPPSLLRWRISQATRELINTPGTPGKRSEADYSVCLSLLYAGATDDDVLAVFQHLPIGTAGKFSEAGPAYLARTIGKARTFMEAHPRPDLSATITNLRAWGRTHSFAPYINPDLLSADGTYRADATDTRVFDAVCDLMEKAGRFEIKTGARRIGRAAGVGYNTALRALARMHGWLFNVIAEKQSGLTIALPVADLQNGFAWMEQLISLRTVQQLTVPSTRNQNLSPDEYRLRKADDPFLSGTSHTMRANIALIAEDDPFVAEVLGLSRAEAQTAGDPEPTAYAIAKELYTIPALGEPSLRAIDYLTQHDAAATAAQIAQATGMKESTTWRACHKLAAANLLHGEKLPNQPTIYTLNPDWQALLSDLAPTMRSYRLSNERAESHYAAAQKWLAREYGTATCEEQAQLLERRYMKLAKKRLANLLILHGNDQLIDTDATRARWDAAEKDPFTHLPLFEVPNVYRTITQDELIEKYQVYALLEQAKFATVDHTDRSLYDAHKRRPEAAASVKAGRTAQRTTHRDEISLIRDLAVAIADVGTPSAAVFAEIMQYGFDPILVKQVLQSPVQMANYETVEDVRLRMLHEDLTPAIVLPPPVQVDYQLRLAGI